MGRITKLSYTIWMQSLSVGYCINSKKGTQFRKWATSILNERTLIFAKGKIVQNGNHVELSKQTGTYKTLWDTQVNGFIL